ncbi:hypothetical protein [Micromonospora okii]|uniref:hypothetical protein n=1 Tax=Micromonospora okii TaxID=1182970 RepID=UPI001E57E53F|nr:hypothetical protein [Micromonospora okii]
MLAGGGDLNAHRALAATVATVEVLRAAVDVGCVDLAGDLGDGLRKAGDLEGAAEAYQTAITAGHEYARRGLVKVLDDRQVEAGCEGGSVPGWVLRDLFAHGHAELASGLLSDMLDRGKRSDLADEAGLVDDLEMARRLDLIERLAATGLSAARVKVDRQRVKATDDLDALIVEGVPGAREERAKRLLAAGDEPGLRTLAADGDRPARRQLAELLIARGRPADGARLLRDLLHSDGGSSIAAALDIGPRLVSVLVELGDEKTLRQLTDDGVSGVRRPLADYWLDREDADQLRRLAVSPDGYLRRRLVTLLERQGRYEEVEEMAEHSNAAHKAASRRRVTDADLPNLLQLVVLGEHGADRAVRKLIETQPDRAELRDLARYGLRPDGTIAT